MLIQFPWDKKYKEKKIKKNNTILTTESAEQIKQMALAREKELKEKGII